MKSIDEIASKHLGKSGDGTLVKPYITPDSIDASLLVGIPRSLNRTQYDIDETDLPFVGYDVWNCYEVSALTNNGYPVSGVVKLVYSSNSPNIVESKSLKLYLNSFNLVRLGETVKDVQDQIEQIVSFNLSECVGSFVQCKFFSSKSETAKGILSIDLETVVPVEQVSFDSYNEDPNLLQVIKHDSQYTVVWSSNVLRSNCRVTNQPDWGDIIISLSGNETVSPKSLLQYIVSMRKENHFHEEIVECVFKRLYDILPDSDIGVCALYTRRGGIDINPIRCTSIWMLDTFKNVFSMNHKHAKTDRQ